MKSVHTYTCTIGLCCIGLVLIAIVEHLETQHANKALDSRIIALELHNNALELHNKALDARIDALDASVAKSDHVALIRYKEVQGRINDLPKPDGWSVYQDKINKDNHESLLEIGKALQSQTVVNAKFQEFMDLQSKFNQVQNEFDKARMK